MNPGRTLHLAASARYQELARVSKSLGGVGDLTAQTHVEHLGIDQLLDVAEAVINMGGSDPSLTERAREAILRATGVWVP